MLSFRETDTNFLVSGEYQIWGFSTVGGNGEYLIQFPIASNLRSGTEGVGVVVHGVEVARQLRARSADLGLDEEGDATNNKDEEDGEQNDLDGLCTVLISVDGCEAGLEG